MGNTSVFVFMKKTLGFMFSLGFQNEINWAENHSKPLVYIDIFTIYQVLCIFIKSLKGNIAIPWEQKKKQLSK